jgi:Tfp pilus assembly protein PilX
MGLINKNERGQAVLIVLLSLSVVLVVVMFILSRSITDISLSSKEEDSMRAFSAAEAGIERVLVTGSATGSMNIGDATFDASVSDFASATSSVVYPISLKSGEIATFWFTRPGDPTVFSGNQMKLCWADDNTSSGASDTPAVEVTVYYKVGAEYRVFRKMVDPYTTRTQNNDSVANNCTINGEALEFSNTVLLTGLTNLQFATVKILYNTTTAHKIGIDVSVSTTASKLLPSQGAKILSDGQFGDANRRVEVYQLHPVAPPIFANAIYSASGIIK